MGRSVKSAAPSKQRCRARESAAGYLFLAPFLLIYAIFNLYPMLQGFVISFFKWNITGKKCLWALPITRLFLKTKYSGRPSPTPCCMC